MNKRIYLEVSNELNRFIKKCIDNNINLYNISYVKDKMVVLIDVKDYLKIKRLNYYSKIRVVKYDGLLNIKKIIKDNMFYISVIFLSFIWMNLLTNYIVDIEIIHSNSGIRCLLKEELDKNNVKKFSLAYSFEELDNITKISSRTDGVVLNTSAISILSSSFNIVYSSQTIPNDNTFTNTHIGM